MQRPHIRALTSFRFFAAMAVVVFHYGRRDEVFAPWALRSVVDFGYQAVTFFFVLSGFILTYTYASRDRRGAMNTTPDRFWVARAARILPGYYAALLLAGPFFLYSYLFAEVLTTEQLVGGVILVPALLQAWHPASALLWNTPAWSLSVEALFYGTFPKLFEAAGRISARPLMILALSGALTAELGRAYLDPGPFGTLSYSFAAYFPLLHLPSFVVGVALGRLYIETPASAGVHRLVLLAGAAALAMVVARAPNWPWLQSAPALGIVFGAVILGAAGAGPLLLLSASPLVLLGEASYATYILHVPISQWWNQIAKRVSGQDLPPEIDLVAYLAIVLSASLLTLFLIEKPCRRWLRDRAAVVVGNPPFGAIINDGGQASVGNVLVPRSAGGDP
jgi:peptidoglycan/LPS O-acetylase OafA/YrhL